MGRVLRELVEDFKLEADSSRMRRIVGRELARLHLELSGDTGSLTPEEQEFAMTGEEMLRDVELKAEQRGTRRMVRLAFERRFGPMPPSIESALSNAASIEELERIMDACLTSSRDEVERMLGPRIH